MTQEQHQDNERLATGFIIALLLHAIIFLVMLFVPELSISPAQEYPDPVIIQLESFTDTAQILAEADNFVTDESAPAPVTAAAIPGPNPASGLPSASGRQTTTQPREEVSRLSEGSLSRLDEALHRSGTSGTGDSGTGSGSDTSGTSNGTTSKWADNTSREPVSRTEPVIPRWVSEQGLRLKVELEVELTADGFVLVKGIKTSSGYSDVDSAVSRAVSRWKYTRLSLAKSITGVITYIIQPR
ncbi:MAG: hypothetical protein EHM28_05720 [Spirochaetaceae bacterium]|nr:MAG: hypothetical protein EHM28_05720 [Spirochaetaceae bacterium]